VTKPIEGTCIDCGKRATATRCRNCNGYRQKFLSAYEQATEDEGLLDAMDRNEMSPRVWAIELGVSRQSAERRVQTARTRQEVIHGIRTVNGAPCWCKFRPVGDVDDPAYEHTADCVEHARLIRIFRTVENIERLDMLEPARR